MIVSLTFSFSQVRPYAEPYGLIHQNLDLNENIISFDEEISINYMQKAAASALPSGVLYRLTLLCPYASRASRKLRRSSECA